MKTKLTTLCIGIALSSYAQLPPLGSPPANNTNAQAGASWYRGGNLPNSTTPPNANIFGTMFNSPIYTVTDGQTRTKLNGTLNYAIGTTPSANRNGFMLLTNAPNMPIFGSSNTLMSPFYGAHTLLHLVGDEGLFLQDNGYRSWMRNGITISNNNDAGFIGVRKMPNLAGGTDDVSDFFGESYLINFSGLIFKISAILNIFKTLVFTSPYSIL